ncbi:beta-ketoacyl synthase N-terminal-like domain-containing protein [Buchnera aphidicola (Neophyllaphis varicolor)]|uniref:beta-ketoacyl synthase N-terminal-like domain-containing protein n=1 Tax=Buchnera aphidicola TaxID=9 RepID=UPI0031B872C3
MNRVVITGLGIVSSIGNNQEKVSASLFNSTSGVVFSKHMKDIGMRSHVLGEIKLNNVNIIKRKFLRFMSDASIYSYIAMYDAITDSNLQPEIYQKNSRVGIIAGSGAGSPHFQVVAADAMRSIKGLKSVSPYIVTKSMTSGISACLSIAFNIYGISYSVSSACSTSSNCIGNAFEQIKLGKQDIIFAGGGEEISWELSCEFDAMGVLSTRYNSTPYLASRAYDIDRDGFVISGGAGILVLEELSHALSRKANIYAEIVGYGLASDGEDMVSPSGSGAFRCMKMALKNIDKNKVDYINSHGTSTRAGDQIELKAIKKLFKEHIPYISSTKSITGHSLGAAGVHEIIYCLLMMKYNFIAPSININHLDPSGYNMNILTNLLRKQINTFISNSFGFGGTNVTLAIQRYF